MEKIKGLDIQSLRSYFQKNWIPESQGATCSLLTDRKYPKNAQKIPEKRPKIVKNQNFEKLKKRLEVQT